MARHRAAGHARRHRNRVGPGGSSLGAAQPHCAYLFTNKRANRMKVLVHDGFGIWLAARRLNRGRFAWSGNWQGQQLELSPEQLQALVVGLPWQRLGPNAEIRLL
ncbi:IS66 family insertion sequence element accessory protein TnpB [Pseudomonas aeruginosa]